MSVLNVNLTVSVINLLGNPVLEDIRASKTCFGFTELKEGIFYRNPERLNELKTSQYKSLIKKHKKTDNAERGFSKRSSKQGSSCASFREVYDQIICEDPSEENPVRDSLFTLGSGDENENYIEVNKIPISKLQLDKISDKPSYEK